ncbi:hypothetical protein [Candidatus Formimonas warabiya]|nr:hypothetical protein [Candidatus Formimonas warabiya]
MEIIRPLIPLEEAIRKKLKQYNRFRLAKIPESAERAILYRPYYYAEMNTTFTVLKKNRESREIVLVDALSGVPALVNGEVDFLTLNEDSLPGRIVVPQISKDQGEEIALDTVAKAIFRKYRHFPRCRLNQHTLIYRLFCCLQDGPGAPLIFPGDGYDLG